MVAEEHDIIDPDPEFSCPFVLPKVFCVFSCFLFPHFHMIDRSIPLTDRLLILEDA